MPGPQTCPTSTALLPLILPSCLPGERWRSTAGETEEKQQRGRWQSAAVGGKERGGGRGGGEEKRGDLRFATTTTTTATTEVSGSSQRPVSREFKSQHGNKPEADL